MVFQQSDIILEIKNTDPYLKNVLNKELLQILVGKIDAELLETVGLKVLESKDVENPDGAHVAAAPHVRLVDGGVDLLHDVDEETAVDALGEGVPDVLRLVHV